MRPHRYRPPGLGRLDRVLFAARRHIQRMGLAYLVRTGRYLLHFGPWRGAARRLISHCRPPRHGPIDSPHLPSLVPAAIAAQLHADSIAVAGLIAAPDRRVLQALADQLPRGDYQRIDLVSSQIERLTRDPALLAVLRHWFQAEPVLLESTLVITEESPTGPRSEQNFFHRDYAGWASLNVFIYLTDVTDDGSPHQVAQGSHRQEHVLIRDLLHPTVSEAEVERRFNGRILTVTGLAGTLFFETTEALHRRQRGEGRRAMLNLLYASHRGWLSRGRSGRRHLQSRASAVAAASVRAAEVANRSEVLTG